MEKQGPLAPEGAAHESTFVHRLLDAWEPVGSAFGRVRGFVGGFLSFAVTIAGVVAVLWLGALLFQDIKRHSVSISDVSVPKELVDRGYSPTVAAFRLRDALDNYASGAKTRMRSAPFYLSDEEPTVVVPTLGLPLDFVADTTARLLGIPGRERVSGEFTETRNTLWLRLRLNDRLLFDRHRSIGRGEATFGDADALLSAAAPALFQATQPYIVAAHLDAENNILGASDAAQNIIDSGLSPNDDNVVMAHILLGNIFESRKKHDLAAAEFNSVVSYRLGAPLAFYGLGKVYQDEGKLSQAELQYDMAIRNDETYSFPHVALANIYFDQKKRDAAILEYQTAIRLDPNNVTPYVGLANAYAAEGKASEAIDQYRRTSRVFPNVIAAYLGLGSIYMRRRSFGDAAQEFRKAITLDRADLYAYIDLGILEVEKSNYAAAETEFKEALALSPKRAATYYDLAEVSRALGRSEQALEYTQDALSARQTARGEGCVIARSVLCYVSLVTPSN
jgi:tetratricopeptide (TPR) repeat protein